MKTYSNASRKPMMYGGAAMKPKKKMESGGRVSDKDVKMMTPAGRVSDKDAKMMMSAAERTKLTKRRDMLQKEVDKGDRPENILEEMRRTIMQITDQLGESATPGRASVDAPAAMRKGGKVARKK